MTGFDSKRQMAADKLQEPEREALKLAVDGLEKILHTFSKDGKVVMSSMIRNELFAEVNSLLKKAKAALAQPPLPVQPVQRQDIDAEILRLSVLEAIETFGRKEFALMLIQPDEPVQEPPSEWAGIKAILDEYGLQAIDFVVDFKAALAQPAQEPVAYVTGMSFGRFIVEPLNSAMVLPVGMALYSAPQGNK